MTQTIENARQETYQESATDPTFLALQQKTLRTTTEYLPFGSKEKIILTPERVIQYFCKPTRTGCVCTIEQAQKFIMLCKARELNPWEGDAFIVGYDAKDGPEFNLITAHQAFLKRADAHEKFEGMESGVIVFHRETDTVKEFEGDYVPLDCELVGGWARVHRKDRKIQMYRRAALKSFQKPFGVWISNPAGMIVKCAEADALRSSFPNNLGGLYMDEELSPLETGAVKVAPPSRLDSVKRSIEQNDPAPNTAHATGGNGAAAATGPAAAPTAVKESSLEPEDRPRFKQTPEEARKAREALTAIGKGEEPAPVSETLRRGPGRPRREQVPEEAAKARADLEAIGKDSVLPPVVGKEHPNQPAGSIHDPSPMEKALDMAEGVIANMDFDAVQKFVHSVDDEGYRKAANLANVELPEGAPEADWRAVAVNARAAQIMAPKAPEPSAKELMKRDAKKFVDTAAAKGAKELEKMLNRLTPGVLAAAKTAAGIEGSISGRKIDELSVALFEAKMIELATRNRFEP